MTRRAFPLPAVLLLVLWAGVALGAEHDEQALARQILAATGVRGGLVVHVGCGDGRLTAALGSSRSTLVHGLDRDAANVATARRHVADRGLRGKVTVERWQGDRLPYTDNLVRLLVSEDLSGVAEGEVVRVLAPGGVAYVRTDGAWVKTGKPWPEDIDEWPHFLHGADNNPVARDRVAGPPRHLQWMCGPAWSKHHEKFPPTIGIVVSAGGRVFYIEDETPPSMFGVKARWFLTARDAFSGVLLWRREMPEWFLPTWGDLGGWAGGPRDYKRRLVAAGDRVYVTLGQRTPVSVLDAATGKTLRTLGQGGPHTELVHDRGFLYVASRAEREPFKITAFQCKTGEKLWEAPGGMGIAVSGGRAFYQTADGHVGGLDAATGRPLWSVPVFEGIDKKHAWRGKLRLTGPIRAGEGVVLVGPGNRGSVLALSAETGKVLWDFVNRARAAWWIPVNAHIIGGLVWVTGPGDDKTDVRRYTLALGLDPLTGKVKKTVPCGQVWNVGHHQRCYPSKATERFLIYSRRGADFLELATGKVALNNWTRGACTYGVMPCNGLLYSPPHSCRCYSETALRGLQALAPAREGRGTGGEGRGEEAERLEKGPAFGQALEPRPSAAATPADWPTYRHDSLRSGATAAEVPAAVAQAWRTKPGIRASSPTVADGKVFVASVDEHCVRALSADSGQAVWEFTTGGRVDSPPTIHNGLALFGSADGWVYCLRASDGALAWRFRAAPGELHVGADGQLESAWPVHGSVLVRDGVAYCAAGRSSFLDGGITVYGLDPATGRKLHEHRLEGPWDDAGMTWEHPNRGFVMPGALPDILAADASRVYMRHLAFDPKLAACTDTGPNFYKAPKRSGENFGGDHKYWCDLLEAPRLSLRSDPKWFFRSYFYQFPGHRLYSTTGLLDDSWHIRSYWSYGQVVGQYLVFRGNRGYAVKAYPNAARWLSFKAGSGYVLYAGDTALPKPGEKRYALRPEEHAWRLKLPLRPKAMVLAGERLFVAGPPDPADPVKALAALDGKLGGVLWAISAESGEKLAEHKLPSPPILDGMAAAGGRLYMTLQDGSVACLGARQ